MKSPANYVAMIESLRAERTEWRERCLAAEKRETELRAEVERLREENEQLKATMGDSLVLPLLSADQIAELEAQEAAEAAKEHGRET